MIACISDWLWVCPMLGDDAGALFETRADLAKSQAAQPLGSANLVDNSHAQ